MKTNHLKRNRKPKPKKVWSPPAGRNEYKVICPVCYGENNGECYCCSGRGYNEVVFEDGKRIE